VLLLHADDRRGAALYGGLVRQNDVIAVRTLAAARALLAIGAFDALVLEARALDAQAIFAARSLTRAAAAPPRAVVALGWPRGVPHTPQWEQELSRRSGVDAFVDRAAAPSALEGLLSALLATDPALDAALAAALRPTPSAAARALRGAWRLLNEDLSAGVVESLPRHRPPRLGEVARARVTTSNLAALGGWLWS